MTEQPEHSARPAQASPNVVLHAGSLAAVRSVLEIPSALEPEQAAHLAITAATAAAQLGRQRVTTEGFSSRFEPLPEPLTRELGGHAVAAEVHHESSGTDIAVAEVIEITDDQRQTWPATGRHGREYNLGGDLDADLEKAADGPVGRHKKASVSPAPAQGRRGKGRHARPRLSARRMNELDMRSNEQGGTHYFN